ncbi:MAG: UbiD family decarboxylase [Chloroflexota bacterium]|nr:UbiD family decarboxylase [Chloroflexota bacterium]
MSTLRSFIQQAEQADLLIQIEKPVDPYLEMAPIIAALDGRPVLFHQVVGSDFRIMSGQCSDRRYFAMAQDCPVNQLIPRLIDAFESPRKPPVVQKGGAPCQEVEMEQVDLQRLPFLTHYAGDAGPYATAAIVIVDDPDTGPNVSFHRLLRLDATHLTARVVERRGLDTALKKTSGDLPVAICIGLPLHVLLAASMAPAPGVNELAIAHALAPTPVVRCLSSDLLVPVEAEFVLEGRISHRTVEEGPFVDLTETWDIVRQQPVIEIDRITHRPDAIYHALLPGQLEHKMLMGMPREPGIFTAVNQVCRCLSVSITPGGASWLHAVVQIKKRHPDDGRKAASAAFQGHGSLKHVVVVDDDIDLHDTNDVEWAIATRFQADRDLMVWHDQPSSSLDPSAAHNPGEKSRTAKMALDATIPWDSEDGPGKLEDFVRVPFPKTDLNRYLD